VDALSKTSASLKSAQEAQNGEVANQEKELRQLHDAADGSSAIANNYASGTSRVSNKFDSVLLSLKALVALLKTSVVTPDGTLVTQEEPDSNGESSQVLKAVRKVLSSHSKLVDAPLLATFTSNSTAAPALTPALLEDLVKTMEKIERTVDDKRTTALTQFASKHEKYMADAQLTVAEQQKKQGLMAEGKRHFEEVVYAVDFTKSVISKDNEMLSQLRTFAAAERKIQNDLTVVRQRQEQTLSNVLDILDGKFKAAAAGQTGGDSQPESPAYAAPTQQHAEWLWEEHQAEEKPVSFLQVREAPKAGLMGIRSEIESALNKKQDTHAILMRIQDALHGQEATAPDAENVRQVLGGMQSLLTELKESKITTDSAKQKCDEQMYRLSEGEASAQASVALMGAAKDHLHITKDAATTNLGGIEKKRLALEQLRNEYEKIRNQTQRSAATEDKDRATVVMALKKAHTVCQRVLPSEEAGALTMIEQLVSLFANVGELEKLHSRAEEELRGALSGYINDYEQLLVDRNMHYEESLASLALTYEELSADLDASTNSLQSLDEVKEMDQEYCNSLLKHYDARSKRHDRLVSLLDRVVPQIPDILNLQRGA